MQLIEISSYPKSGNTWTRFLVKEVMDSIMGEKTPLCISANQHKDQPVRNSVHKLSIDGLSKPVGFYKSHVVDLEGAQPESILYVYRHPLDVFLSSLNFLYHQSPKLNSARTDAIFMNGRPKGVEQILKDGEMDYYFDRFCKDLGACFYRGMLKERAGYFDHVNDALARNNAHSITYESLIDDASGVIRKVVGDILGLDLSGLPLNLSNVDNRTVNNSKRKAFFWQAKKGTRFDFLDLGMIDHFEAEFAEQLSAIGY